MWLVVKVEILWLGEETKKLLVLQCSLFSFALTPGASTCGAAVMRARVCASSSMPRLDSAVITYVAARSLVHVATSPFPPSASLVPSETTVVVGVPPMGIVTTGVGAHAATSGASLARAAEAPRRRRRNTHNGKVNACAAAISACIFAVQPVIVVGCCGAFGEWSSSESFSPTSASASSAGFFSVHRSVVVDWYPDGLRRGRGRLMFALAPPVASWARVCRECRQEGGVGNEESVNRRRFRRTVFSGKILGEEKKRESSNLTTSYKRSSQEGGAAHLAPRGGCRT